MPKCNVLRMKMFQQCLKSKAIQKWFCSTTVKESTTNNKGLPSILRNGSKKFYQIRWNPLMKKLINSFKIVNSRQLCSMALLLLLRQVLSEKLHTLMLLTVISLHYSDYYFASVGKKENSIEMFRPVHPTLANEWID